MVYLYYHQKITPRTTMADKNYSNIPPELKEKLKKIIEEDFTEESSKKKN